MRHAVLGVGGVGGLLGVALAHAGADVVLLMRPETLSSYPGRLRLESPVLGDLGVEVPATAHLDAPVDVLWVATKATQLPHSLERAPAPLCGRVIPLLNGIDHLALLTARYPDVIPGAMRVESEQIGPGHIRQSSPFVRVDLGGAADVVDELRTAGVDARVGGGGSAVLWDKLAFLAPMALATTAYAAAFGEVRDRELFRRCQSEVVAVALAEGVAVDVVALTAATAGAPAGMRSSMQKDHLLGRPLETDAIAGPIVRAGRSSGIPTSATSELLALITGAP